MNISADTVSKLEHRGLRYYAAAVEFESISLAADHLAISQPALSKAIARLESDLGTALLERGRGGVRPTEAGRLVLDYAERVQRDLSGLLGELGQLQSGAGGALRIGATADWVESILPRALVTLQRERAELDTTVTVLASNRLQEALREGAIELYFGPTAEEEFTPGLHFETFATDWTGVYGGPGHPVIESPPHDLAALLDYPWILTRPDTFMRRTAIRLFAARGLPPPRPTLESNSVPLLVELAASGRFLTFLSDISARPYGDTRLVALPMAGARLPRAKGVVTRESEPLSPVHQALVDAVRTQLADES